jgi:Co/Zn/Cd efflux system component
MGHGHDHGPGGAADHRGRLAAAFAITATILLAEVAGALVTGSLALLVDAAHMLTDAAGLGLALFAAHLVLRPATSRRTWGYRRAEVLAALGQSAMLLAVGVYVLVEGVRRLVSPPPVAATGLVIFGVHDVHASLIATGLPVLSAHVVVEDECFRDGHAGRILDELQECVATHFDVPVEHSTFQIEPASHPDHEHPGHR